jgi:hypothetical protein
MSRSIFGIAVVLTSGVFLIAGCDRGAKVPLPSLNPAAIAKAAMDEYDTNKDGKISGEELDKCPALRSALARLNPASANAVGADGSVTKGPTAANKAEIKEEGLTAEMIQNAVQGWVTKRLGRVTYTCQVYHNGKPLQGALVKFVPEKFMGSGIAPAEAITGETGGGSVSIPKATPPGISVGFYRIEITKDGENIPAKYNTETTLGSAAFGPNGTGTGATFNLKY